MFWNKIKAYGQLIRIDKPVGILLLWFPTAWALWMANQGLVPTQLMLLFFLGTVLMRSAGCLINDMVDRNLDLHVERTRNRLLTSGQVSLFEAFILLFILLFGALLVLLCLPRECIDWAIFAVLISCFYPFCKRFLNAPQVVLGVAFSMGIPMAYVASYVPLDTNVGLLFLINFLWIVSYDTMYAMTDKVDDLKIGIKSTAIYFADHDRLIIGFMQLTLHGLWIYWAMTNEVTWRFYLLWTSAGLVLFYQQKLIHRRDPTKCFKAFKVSVYYGVLMWIALI